MRWTTAVEAEESISIRSRRSIKPCPSSVCWAQERLSLLQRVTVSTRKAQLRYSLSALSDTTAHLVWISLAISSARTELMATFRNEGSSCNEWKRISRIGFLLIQPVSHWKRWTSWRIRAQSYRSRAAVLNEGSQWVIRSSNSFQDSCVTSVSWSSATSMTIETNLSRCWLSWHSLLTSIAIWLGSTLRIRSILLTAAESDPWRTFCWMKANEVMLAIWASWNRQFVFCLMIEANR